MTPAQTILIFANPISGRGRGRALADDLGGRFRAGGYEVRTFFDKPQEVDPGRLETGSRAAVVIGGDGTLRAVAGLLFRTFGEGGGNGGAAGVPPLLIVPMGTANLMGQHLGFRKNDPKLADRVVESVRQRRVKWFDAARAGGDLFLLIASVGLDSHVVHALARTRTGPIRFASYVRPTLAALAGYAFPPLGVSVDGRVVFPAAPAMAFVANIPEYGTGFPLLPGARPDDGLLDVCVVPSRSRGDVLRLAMDAAAGQHLLGEGTVLARGRAVRIESPGPVPVQVDGEAAGHTPLDIEMLAARLPFILPGA